jgi:hypothetical protein
MAPTEIADCVKRTDSARTVDLIRITNVNGTVDETRANRSKENGKLD